MIWNKFYITGISKPNINIFFWSKHQDTTIMVSCINEENMEISEQIVLIVFKTSTYLGVL